MSAKVIDRLKERFGGDILSTSCHRGDDVAVVARERIADVLGFLRDDGETQMDFPTDLTAVDWLGRAEPRFEVVYQLYSTTRKHRVRLKVRVPEDDPVVASATPLFPGWGWFEREVFDMYGIKFAGHPDLRRIFMYDEFVGHPLRKDYPKEKRQPLARREGDS